MDNNEKKWSVAAIPERYDFEDEIDPTKRLTLMRTEAMGRFNALSPELVDYVQRQRQKYNSPDAGVSVAVVDPGKKDNFELILWTVDNNVKQSARVDETGVVVLDSRLPFPDLPPGNLLSLGIRSDTEQTAQTGMMTNGSETVIARDGNNEEALAKVIKGLDSMPAVITKSNSPQS